MKLSLSYQVVLASGSPRRKKMLDLMLTGYEIMAPNVDETIDDHYLSPAEVCMYLAEKKCNAVLELVNPKCCVIAADTVVALENKILGKPAGRDEAISMLSSLQGKPHHVFTGVCMRYSEKKNLFFESTQVYFRAMEIAEIKGYVDSAQPFDKAGSYGIQDWIGYSSVERIEGSYANVEGMPASRVYEQLRDWESQSSL